MILDPPVALRYIIILFYKNLAAIFTIKNVGFLPTLGSELFLVHAKNTEPFLLKDAPLRMLIQPNYDYIIKEFISGIVIPFLRCIVSAPAFCMARPLYS